MKAKDAVPLLGVIVVSAIIALIFSSIVAPDPPESRQIENVQKINPEFPDPRKGEDKDKVLHDDLIDTFPDIDIGVKLGDDN